MSDCVLIKTWATMDAYELSAIDRYTLLHGIQEAADEIERLEAIVDRMLLAYRRSPLSETHRAEFEAAEKARQG